jgi:hypothetical protein
VKFSDSKSEKSEDDVEPVAVLLRPDEHDHVIAESSS